eukprot:366114-Chlamydomonas_euryale.AAC.5
MHARVRACSHLQLIMPFATVLVYPLNQHYAVLAHLCPPQQRARTAHRLFVQQQCLVARRW